VHVQILPLHQSEHTPVPEDLQYIPVSLWTFSVPVSHSVSIHIYSTVMCWLTPSNSSLTYIKLLNTHGCDLHSLWGQSTAWGSCSAVLSMYIWSKMNFKETVGFRTTLIDKLKLLTSARPGNFPNHVWSAYYFKTPYIALCEIN
jgi:hypothetical protein